MIQTQTRVEVSDNTGVYAVVCIRVVSRRWAEVGDTFIAVVKESLPRTSIRRSEVVRAVLIRTKKEIQRDDGSRIRFDSNSAVLVNKDGNPRGSRVFGPVATEVRNKNFAKVVSLARVVV
jgi:large subunit ribosomal protein L14